MGKGSKKVKKPVKTTDPNKDVSDTLYKFYLSNLSNGQALLTESLRVLELLGEDAKKSPTLSHIVPLLNIGTIAPESRGVLLKQCVEGFIKAHGGGVEEVPVVGPSQAVKNPVDLGLPAKERKDTHIFLACPCYGGMVTYKYMAGVMELQRICMELGIKLTWKPIGNESLIQRGRMVLSSIFIENPEYTHLFFIDADIGFDPRSVIKMLQFDQPLVTQAYPKKSIDWGQVKGAVERGATPEQLSASSVKYAVSWLNERTPDGKVKISIEKGYAKVRDAATGFMLIKREVFERMMARWPNFNYTNDVEGYGIKGKVWRFFDCMVCPETDRYLSEDYAFCHRWRELGGDVWMDVNSCLSHSGTYEFRGHLGNYIQTVLQGGPMKTNTPVVAPPVVAPPVVAPPVVAPPVVAPPVVAPPVVAPPVVAPPVVAPPVVTERDPVTGGELGAPKVDRKGKAKVVNGATELKGEDVVDIM